jgi:hypothetical protein
VTSVTSRATVHGTAFSASRIPTFIGETEGSAPLVPCVEAGSSTSTVILRVVGGDEKGSLKSERVKYGRESQGTQIRERLRWQEPAAYI